VSRASAIYVSAGEPSGDAHAAAVVAALKRRLPDVRVEAFGGPRLEAAGATVLDRMERYSVVGFVEALWKLPAHFRLLARVRAAFRARRYDLVVLVDYPGYHLRAAAAAAAAGIPVLYYIAPQMWAWGASRVRRLTSVTRLAVILPFEEAFFRERGTARRRRRATRPAACSASSPGVPRSVCFPGAGRRRSAGCGRRSARRPSACAPPGRTCRSSWRARPAAAIQLRATL